MEMGLGGRSETARKPMARRIADVHPDSRLEMAKRLEDWKAAKPASIMDKSANGKTKSRNALMGLQRRIASRMI
jgi:hypothetical protein